MLNCKSGPESSVFHSLHSVMELIYMLIPKMIFPFQCVLLKAATIQKDGDYKLIQFIFHNEFYARTHITVCVCVYHLFQSDA